MRPTTARSPGSPSHHRGAAICISLVALFLSMLTPLMTLEVTDAEAATSRISQGVPPDCEPGFVVSDDGTACIEEPAVPPTDVPTETPVDESPVTDETPTEIATATEVATVAPPAETLRLTINVFHCDNLAFDPYLSDNAQMVLDTCTGQGQATFEITSSIPVAMQTGSMLEFQVGPGLAIQEQLQPGFDDPIANCFLLDAGGNVVDQIGPGVASGGGWRVGDTSGDVHCDWYQIEPGDDQVALDASPSADAPVATPAASPAAAPAAGTGAIVIFAFNCPAGFDVSTVDANPRGACPTASKVLFEIDDTIDDGKSFSLRTNSFGQGSVGKLPADTYTMVQDVPNGVTSTFLWDCYATNTTSNRTDPLAMGSVAQFELADGAGVRCDWFNVTGGSGRVVISTHGCGADVPAYVLDYNQLLARCSIDTGAIGFSVVTGLGSGYSEDRTASNNPLTVASFDDVPSGVIGIVAELPGGWGLPIVYCQVLGDDGSIVLPPTDMELGAGQLLGFELETGHTLGCDWFNVAGGNVEVRMVAYACPAGFDAYRFADDASALGASCKTDPGAVSFIVTDGNLFGEERTATAAAPAYWIVAPAGELMVTESLPEGYGPPIVHCGTFRRDADNNYVTLSQEVVRVGYNATIQYNVSPGQLLQCVWFNVPGGTGYVSLDTRACPEGLDVYNASRLQLEQGCNEPIEPVAFAVASGSFTQARSTGVEDHLALTAVPSGELTVTQTSPTDYQNIVAYCYEKVQGRALTPKERIDVSANRSVTLPLKANGWQHCEWYFGHTPQGTVTVNTWACPDPLTPGMDRTYYQQKCTRALDGIEVTLTGIAGSSTQTTGNGEAGWTGIQPGLLTITEHIPKEYGQPIVFCSGPKLDRNFPVTDGTIEHELLAGDYLTCDWFNVPGGA